ncbi:MAG: membrane or secreted protein [Flavobacteriales bacterium]
MVEWKVALLAIGLLTLGFAGMAIKLWAKKGGKFPGTCASQNPLLKGGDASCSLCGKPADEIGNCEAARDNSK